MVIAFFSLDDKDGRSQSFQNTFLLVHISMDIAFGMSFLTLNNIKMNFIDQELK